MRTPSTRRTQVYDRDSYTTPSPPPLGASTSTLDRRDDRLLTFS